MSDDRTRRAPFRPVIQASPHLPVRPSPPDHQNRPTIPLPQRRNTVNLDRTPSNLCNQINKPPEMAVPRPVAQPRNGGVNNSEIHTQRDGVPPTYRVIQYGHRLIGKITEIPSFKEHLKWDGDWSSETGQSILKAMTITAQIVETESLKNKIHDRLPAGLDPVRRREIQEKCVRFLKSSLDMDQLLDEMFPPDRVQMPPNTAALKESGLPTNQTADSTPNQYMARQMPCLSCRGKPCAHHAPVSSSSHTCLPPIAVTKNSTQFPPKIVEETSPSASTSTNGIASQSAAVSTNVGDTISIDTLIQILKTMEVAPPQEAGNLAQEDSEGPGSKGKKRMHATEMLHSKRKRNDKNAK